MNRTLRGWNVATGKEVRRFPIPDGYVGNMALSSDGRLLATDETSYHVRFWDIDAGKLLGQFTWEGDYLYSMHWLPGTTTLAMLCLEDFSKLSLQFWDIRQCKKRRLALGNVDDGLGCERPCLGFAPDGKTLALGDTGKDIRLLDLATGKTVGRLTGHQGIVRQVLFSPDGKILASLAADKTLRFWRVATGKEVTRLPVTTIWSTALAFSPDGRTLASPGQGNEIRLWEVATGKERLPASSPWSFARPLGFLPDGKTLLGIGGEHLQLWDAATGKMRPGFPPARPNGIPVLSPNGKTLALGLPDQSLEVLDVATGNKLAAFPPRIGKTCQCRRTSPWAFRETANG